MTISLPITGQQLLALAAVLVLLLVWIIIRGSRSTHGKFSAAVYVGYRQARRRSVVGIRRVFQLDEDIIRDQTIEGLRVDQTNIVQVLQEQIAHINRLEARLTWYEKNVPMVRSQFAAFRSFERRQLKKVRRQVAERDQKE